MNAGSYRRSPPALRGAVGNSEGSRLDRKVEIDPVTTDPKGEAHLPPVRNTPALTLPLSRGEVGNYGGILLMTTEVS